MIGAGLRARALLIGTVACGLAPVVLAQVSPTAGSAILRGTVVDDADDRALPGATVAIEALGVSVRTDSAGSFRLPVSVPGRHIVSVRLLGYAPLTTGLNFAAHDTLEYDFTLAKLATPLPEVNVKAQVPPDWRLAGFEERRKLGGGQFITPAALEKMGSRRMSEVLRTIAGVRVITGTSGSAWVASSRGSGSILRGFTPITRTDSARGANTRQCYAAVVLDGIYVFTGHAGQLLFDINTFQVSAIAAVEYHSAATMPIQYRTTGVTCGLLMIWMK